MGATGWHAFLFHWQDTIAGLAGLTAALAMILVIHLTNAYRQR